MKTSLIIAASTGTSWSSAHGSSCQSERGDGPMGWAFKDVVEDIGRGGALILQGERARAAFGPPPRDLVFLADAGFVLEPDFERLAGGGGDARQEGWDFF